MSARHRRNKRRRRRAHIERMDALYMELAASAMLLIYPKRTVALRLINP